MIQLEQVETYLIENESDYLNELTILNQNILRVRRNFNLARFSLENEWDPKDQWSWAEKIDYSINHQIQKKNLLIRHINELETLNSVQIKKLYDLVNNLYISSKLQLELDFKVIL